MPAFACRCLLASLLAFAMPLGARAAQSVQSDDPVHATLLAETSTVVPGTTVWLGLSLQHAPHWHTYWRNPGDSGLPTKVRFTLPAHYAVDDITWPAPQRFPVDGLTNFGYEGETLLPIALHVPASASLDSIATVQVEASWLMCREQCLPGKASLALSLPVRAKAVPADAHTLARFIAARASLPATASWATRVERDGKDIVVSLRGSDLPSTQGLDVFVAERKTVDHAAPRITADQQSLQVRFAQSDYFTEMPKALNLVLVQKQGTVSHAWQVLAPASTP